MKTTKEHYWLWMMNFGVITILKLLNYFQEIEEYEECQKIIDCINWQNEKTGSPKLKTVLDKTVYEDVKEEFKKFGLTGEFIDQSTDTYFFYVLDEIQNIK